MGLEQDSMHPFGIDRGQIRDGVCHMLEVNLGIRPGEEIVFLTDVPDLATWRHAAGSPRLADLTGRALLALTAAEIAEAAFAENRFIFCPYLAPDTSGAEPSEDATKAMVNADIAVAINTYSLTHTSACDLAREAGTRGVSMPGGMPYMFYHNSPLMALPADMAEAGAAMAACLGKADIAEVTTPAGTAVKLGLAGRPGKFMTGDLTQPGVIDNLPAGEAFIVPVEGTAEGLLVVEAGWFPGLTETMTLVFENGQVVEVRDGGKVGDEYRTLLDFDNENLALRRNCAELGIGTNPLAQRPTSVLEAEKIKGTVHIAIGSNAGMGGNVQADLHQDFVLQQPTLALDGRVIIHDGKWRI